MPGYRTDLIDPLRNRDVVLRPAQPRALRITEIRDDWSLGSDTKSESVRLIYLELLPEIAPLVARYRDKTSEWPAEQLMEQVDRHVFLSDWTRFAAELRESLVEAFVGNDRPYRLRRPPQQPAAYYVSELDHLVDALRAEGAEAELESTDVLLAIQAVAVLDGDWDVDPKAAPTPPWSRAIAAAPAPGT